MAKAESKSTKKKTTKLPKAQVVEKEIVTEKVIETKMEEITPVIIEETTQDIEEKKTEVKQEEVVSKIQKFSKNIKPNKNNRYSFGYTWNGLTYDD